MPDCPACGAELETPFACTACGVLLAPEPTPSPFAALGLEPSFAVDAKDLKRRLLRFSRLVHPDFHGTADAETQERAEQASAALNHAFEVLSDDTRRADELVRAQRGPSEQDERQMPQEFLMEVLEWNETLEEAKAGAPGGPQRAALVKLGITLEAKRAEVLAEIAALLTPLPFADTGAHQAIRKKLNAVRYVDRTLAEIEALRLSEASAT